MKRPWPCVQRKYSNGVSRSRSRVRSRPVSQRGQALRAASGARAEVTAVAHGFEELHDRARRERQVFALVEPHAVAGVAQVDGDRPAVVAMQRQGGHGARAARTGHGRDASRPRAAGLRYDPAMAFAAVTLTGIDPPGVLAGARLWLRGDGVPVVPSPEAVVSVGGAPGARGLRRARPGGRGSAGGDGARPRAGARGLVAGRDAVRRGRRAARHGAASGRQPGLRSRGPSLLRLQRVRAARTRRCRSTASAATAAARRSPTAS